jgi:hypothetical protein
MISAFSRELKFYLCSAPQKKQESNFIAAPTWRYELCSARNSYSNSVDSYARRYQLVGKAYVYGIMDGELVGQDIEPETENFENI